MPGHDRTHGRAGLAEYPKQHDWGSLPDSVRRWKRWGTNDFHSKEKPHPICFAAAFDPDAWKRVSLETVQRAGVQLRLHSWFSRALVEDGVIKGVICESKSGREAILGKVVIDATGDLDVAAASAGAPHISGSYLVTTVFRLGGVDTDEAERFENGGTRGLQGARSGGQAPPRRRLGKLGLKTPLPGIVWCNCPHMPGLDGLKVDDLTRAEIQGRNTVHKVVDFIRTRLPGFANCYVVDMAPQTGIRQTRLLEGEYVMTKEDVSQRTRFSDSVARGRDYYYPYRTLVPRSVDNLLGCRPALLVHLGGAEDLARDSALHGDGRGHRRGRGARARRRRVGARCRHRQAAACAARAGRRSGRSGRPERRRSRPRTHDAGGGLMSAAPASQPSAAALPLDGIRVIDFTQVMMGPVCTQMLADHGADVIKIERKGAGDLSRSTFAPVAGQDNPIFCSLNRNKRSVEIDLRDAAQMELVKALIADADVVTNNFRAGVMERLGLGYEDCKRLNPRIIYAVGTGFGETGPYAHKGGQDVLAQAMTGVMARRADDAIPVSIYPTALADYTAGMHMVQGILMALLQRERSGEGQKIAVSLYDSMLAMQMQEAAMIMMADSEVNWAAMPLSGVFQTTTGPLVLVGAFKANPLRDICAALEIEDLSLDARFAICPRSSRTRKRCTTFSESASPATRESTG